MNPYQVMGVIACCVSIFAGVVTFLTVQGVPLPVSFLGVYLSALWFMQGMQRRARESCGCDEYPRRRHRESSIRQTRPIDEPVVVSIASRGVVTLHEPLLEPVRRREPRGTREPDAGTSGVRTMHGRKVVFRA